VPVAKVPIMKKIINQILIKGNDLRILPNPNYLQQSIIFAIVLLLLHTNSERLKLFNKIKKIEKKNQRINGEFLLKFHKISSETL
jgi:hypothetical protein